MRGAHRQPYMARRPSAQQECSPEGRPWGRACVLQGKGFLDCRAASHGLGPPGHSPAGELREYGCVGSLNSNWARFSLHWQKQNWRSAYPTHTHQTVLLRLGPAASTLPRAAPLPTISPNPPHSSQAAFCLSLSLPPSLFLLLSVSVYYSFCLSLLLTLCFGLYLFLSLPLWSVPSQIYQTQQQGPGRTGLDSGPYPGPPS